MFERQGPGKVWISVGVGVRVGGYDWGWRWRGKERVGAGELRQAGGEASVEEGEAVLFAMAEVDP